MEQYKTCNKCGQLKSLEEWAKKSSTKNGLDYCCKLCRNATGRASYHKNRDQISIRRKSNFEQKAKNAVITKKWYKANPEKAKKLWSDWAKNNPDKTAKKNGVRRSRLRNAMTYLITDKQIKALRAGPCFYCGSSIAIALDHVIPISRGGNHSIGNLVSACKPCNSSKRDKFITEWKKSDLTRRLTLSKKEDTWNFTHQQNSTEQS